MKGSQTFEASPAERLGNAGQEESEQYEQVATDAPAAGHLPLDYRAFFESAPWPCVVTDTRTVVQQVNHAATALFGNLASRPRGTLLADWVEPLDRETLEHWLSHGRSFPPSGCLTVRLRSHTDQLVRAELSVQALRDRSGRPVVLCWFIRDIPQPKVAQRLGQAHPFQALVQAAPVGIIQTDTERRCLFANERWQQLTGLSLTESMDSGWIRAVHPEDRACLFDEWSRAVEEARGFSIEHRIVALSGEVLWVLTRVSPQWSDTGELTGFVGTIGDVTERKQETEGLHASERRFRVLTERSWDAVSLLSAEGVILYDNPAASTRILGFATGELVGQSAFDHLHPEDQERISRLFAELVAQPGATVTADFRHRHKDGSWRWIECTGTNLLAEPSVQAIVCNYRDITEHRRAEEAIKRRNRELAALNTVTAAVSSTLELPVVLDTFKRLVTEELSVPAGMIYLRVPDEGRLQLQDTWGLPCRVSEHLTDFPLVGSDYDLVVVEKQALLIPDFRQISHLCGQGLDAAHPEWKSFLCVPLLANDCVQGAIGLFCLEPLIDEQVPVFEALGREMGVAIQNARLFEQVLHEQAQREALSRQLVELQEMERRHLARELHDEVGQLLTGLKLSLEVATRRMPEGDPQQLSEALRQVTELIARVRDLSLDLRPAMLDDLGLLPTLLWHFDRYTTQTNIRVVFEHTGLERRFSTAIETAAYRIVQEALTNVARHGDVREVSVTLWAQGEHLAVEVHDRGRGFNPQIAWALGGTSGLLGMKERAVLLGGQLSVSSVKGRGTQLLALLPVNQSEMAGGQAEGTSARQPPVSQAQRWE